MKFKIPKSFDMGPQRISVIFVDECKAKGVKAHGSWNYRKGIIELEKNEKVSQEFIEKTFFHELTHCILNNIAEDSLNDNEALVDRIAGSFYQFIKTME